MERFEIEDIVAQDKNGIVYQANDRSLERTVSLRRFLPFGQSGGGLDKDEATAFETAVKRLSSLEHQSMRSVIYGSVDPIDSIPFLVTEWVDGESLKTILAEETMEPALVIDVLRIALEVSLAISHILGEEVVWVETEVESIVVGTEKSGRGFTFWISPFKWLGAEFESRKISSIVTLAEELTGWQKKLVSDHAGYGLGGWLKWLRNNPEVGVREALDSLVRLTEEKEQAPALVTSKPLQPQFKQTSSKAPFLITAAIALLATLIALFYFNRTAEVPPVVIGYTEQKISPVIVDPVAIEPAEDENAPPPEQATTKPSPVTPPAVASARQPTDSATARVEALAEKLSREAAESSEQEAQKISEMENRADEQRAAYEQRGKILSPEQHALVRTFEGGTPITLRGVVRGIRTSRSGKSIYLNFTEPYDSSLTNGIAHQSDFQGDYTVEAFEGLIGKPVTLSGTIFIESPKRTYYVKITSMNQIK